MLKKIPKLSAYSNELNKTIWTIGEKEIGTKSTLKKISEIDISAIGQDKDKVELVEDSDYISANINGRNLIINSLTGQVMFNSELDLGDEVLADQMFLPSDNAYVFIVRQKKDFKLKYFDLNTRSVKWEAPLGKEASLGLGLISKSQITRKDRSQSFRENLYSLINNKLYSLDKETGKLKWMLDDVNSFFICQNNETVAILKNKGGLLSSKQILNIVNNKTGKYLWEDDIETKAFIKLEDWGDKLLVAYNSGFNMYNLSNGAKTWKKDVKGKNFKQVLPIDKDFLYVAENDMTLIDANGKDKWKKDIEISDNDDDEVHYLGKTLSGKVMYITATYGNMVDYVTGKKLWKRNIKFNEKRPLLYVYDEKNDIFLIYNDEELYKFNPNIDDKPEAFAKVKAKSDKTMSSIELFDWGVSVTSQSEVIGVGNDGKVLFQKQYQQPGEAGRIALKTAGIIGSSYFGIRGGAQRGMANSTVSWGYRDEKGIEHTSTSYLLDENSRNKLNNEADKNLAVAATIGALTQNVAKRFRASLKIAIKSRIS